VFEKKHLFRKKHGVSPCFAKIFMRLPWLSRQGLRMNRAEDISEEGIVISAAAAFSGKRKISRESLSARYIKGD